MLPLHQRTAKAASEVLTMALFEVGRLCVKLAGRDAGLKCVVVDVIDHVYVLVDGETRRKKVNIRHLEPLDELIEIKAGAAHEEVKKVLSKLGLEARETNPKHAAPRVLATRKGSGEKKEAAVEKKASKKPAAKKKKE